MLDYYGAWVEGGIITDSVLSGLMDGIGNNVGQVQGLVDSATAIANVFGPFSSSYLLPGRDDDKGNTDDDVTMEIWSRTPSTRRTGIHIIRPSWPGLSRPPRLPRR